MRLASLGAGRNLVKQLFTTNLITEMLSEDSGYDFAFKRDFLKEGVVEGMYGGEEEEDEDDLEEIEDQGEEEKINKINAESVNKYIWDEEEDEDDLEEGEQIKMNISSNQLVKNYEAFQKECEKHEEEVRTRESATYSYSLRLHPQLLN